jgi:hypothetical protein
MNPSIALCWHLCYTKVSAALNRICICRCPVQELIPDPVGSRPHWICPCMRQERHPCLGQYLCVCVCVCVCVVCVCVCVYQRETYIREGENYGNTSKDVGFHQGSPRMQVINLGEKLVNTRESSLQWENSTHPHRGIYAYHPSNHTVTLDQIFSYSFGF